MLDKLKALFIVQEEEENNKKKSPSGGAIDFTKEGVSSSRDYSNAEGAVNNEIMTDLLLILNDNNQDGFDYLEYKNAIKSLESLDMDERTRYRSAFATAKSLGVTIPKLLTSIGFYQKILQEEQQKFIKSIKSSALNISVAEKKDIIKRIASKKEQIKQLTKEISALEKKIYGVNSKGHSTGDFESTTNKLIQEMREDIKKINKYL